MQRWYVEHLPLARKLLSNFPVLNRILEGFTGYENKVYREHRNFVLLMCLPDPTGKISTDSIKRLTQVEKALSRFNVLDWPSHRLNHLVSRLTHLDAIQSKSALTELMVAEHFANKPAAKVSLYPPLRLGGFSDLKVEIDGLPIYLEIGSLGESLPDSLIQNILQTCAAYLGQRIERPCYLRLHIDTAKLVFQGNKIDVEDSLQKLKSEIDVLKLQKLSGSQVSFDLDNLRDAVVNEQLYNEISPGLLPSYFAQLLENLRSSETRNWLEAVDPSNLSKVELITYVAALPSSSLLVEIYPEGFYPSEAGKAELTSFVNHLVRNVRGQIDESQLEDGAPNIVMVQGYHWLALADWVELLDIEPIYNGLKRFFAEIKEPKLSGVAVFSKDIGSAFYVPNDFADRSSVLLRSAVSELDLKWLDET